VTPGPTILPLPRRLAAALVVGLALAPLPCATASAQQVVVVVSGEPITAVDIAQRSRLAELSTHKTPSRQEVLDELIDEKLKLQVTRRYKLEVTEAEVNNAFNGIASRARTTPQAFAQALAHSGINVEAFKTRLKADIAWQQIIRGKFQSNFQIGDKDVIAALETDKKDDSSVGYDYTLRPVLLIVPRGSPEPLFAARRREAEGLRNMFQNCDEGLRLARGLKDVAIRDPIVRSSADFAPAQRDVLNNTPVGRLTPPEVTLQGIELFAVCAKKDGTGDTPTKREVRDKMLQDRFVAQGKRYLQELRKSAMIEYR
jgi:peptidyl-prolyl cis-trans isomerase SurA